MKEQFEQKIRRILYEKGLLTLKTEPRQKPWNSETFLKNGFDFGVHLEVTSDNPYHCFEVYSEASTTEPNHTKWEHARNSMNNVLKKDKRLLKSAFGSKVPKLNVDLFIVNYGAVNQKRLEEIEELELEEEF